MSSLCLLAGVSFFCALFVLLFAFLQRMSHIAHAQPIHLGVADDGSSAPTIAQKVPRNQTFWEAYFDFTTVLISSCESFHLEH